MKLLLVMVVKNHVDIITANLLWHLNHGVDFAIVTDNGSTDGTLEALEDLHKQGRIFLRRDPSLLMEGQMHTTMARLARDEYGADWIMPVDADEIWVPRSGTLKEELGRGQTNLFYVRTVNFVPTAQDDARDPNPVSRMRYKVERPPAIPRIPYLFKRIQRKIVCRASDLQEIHDGGHEADVGGRRSEVSTNITIFHYPLRTREQFFSKVIMGGELIERNAALAKDYGYHWRRWYEQYKRGQLEREWARMHLGRLRLGLLSAVGIVEKDTRVSEKIHACA
jgi:glycosyltransferase involved in cell wall biosynthesis